MTTVASLFERNLSRGPSFDVIRLLAAFVVLASHSAVVVGRNVIPDFSNRQISLGGLAVAVFFVLSGFVVMESFKRDPNPFSFLRKRALRIYPALILLVLVTVFVLGPLLTAVPLGSYFSSRLTGLYLLNGIVPFNYLLPGVFADNPTHVVNGSLWTLRYEIICYAAVALFGARFLARPVLVVVIALAAEALMPTLWILFRHGGAGFVANEILQAGTTVGYFFGGAAISLFSARIPVGARHVALACALVAVSLATYGFYFVFPFAGAYLVVVLGNSKVLAFTGLRRGFLSGDFSYGFYIFAFPIQQIVRQSFGDAAGFWTVLFVSLPIVLALAMLSWHFVEKPALRLKHRGGGLLAGTA